MNVIRLSFCISVFVGLALGLVVDQDFPVWENLGGDDGESVFAELL